MDSGSGWLNGKLWKHDDARERVALNSILQ